MANLTYSGTSLINSLARRLRDTSNLGYSRTDLLSILNNCHRAVNSRLSLVTEDTTLTLGDTALYNKAAINSPRLLRVIEVSLAASASNASHPLTRVNWASLVHQHPQWLRLQGPQPEIWATLGRNLLAIVPIPRDLGLNANVRYVLQLPNMADTATLIDDGSGIPDQHYPIMLDLAESVALFKGREFANMQIVLKRAAASLGLEDILQDKRREGSVTRK